MVGDVAIMQGALSRVDLSRVRQDDDIVALVAEAFLKLGVEGDTALVVGAPVDYYADVKARWVIRVSDREGIQVVGEGFDAGTVDKAMEKPTPGKPAVCLAEIVDFTTHELETEYKIRDITGDAQLFVPGPQTIPQPKGKSIWIQGRLHKMGRYRDLLCGSWNINGALVNVVECVVLPEPMGAFFNAALGDEGKVRDTDLLKKRVGIIDGGMYTTDYVMLDGGKFVDRLSWSVKGGVSYLLDVIQKHLSSEHGLDVEVFRLMNALRTRDVMVSGMRLDLGNLIDEASRELGGLLAQRMEDKWEDELLDRLLLVGGAAYYVQDSFESYHPEVPDEAEWVNVVGFERFCNWMPEPSGRK
jgi:hypothetical protein